MVVGFWVVGCLNCCGLGFFMWFGWLNGCCLVFGGCGGCVLVFIRLLVVEFITMCWCFGFVSFCVLLFGGIGFLFYFGVGVVACLVVFGCLVDLFFVCCFVGLFLWLFSLILYVGGVGLG